MSRLRWKDNIKMHFRLIRCEVANMFNWGIIVEFCEHGNEPSRSVKRGKILDKNDYYKLIS